MADFKEDPISEADRALVEYVTTHCDRWREFKESKATPVLSRWSCFPS